jgi:hypothetical protein
LKLSNKIPYKYLCVITALVHATSWWEERTRARTQETLKRDGRAKRQAASNKLQKNI